jgi:carbonic anhydrase
MGSGDLPARPAKRLAVVACMDARLDPARVLGLEQGDAHVIRNAGGLARDALRSLVISQQLLGTREVIILQHTDCGMLKFENEELHARLDDAAREIDFMPFSDLDQSVRDDVQFLKESPLIPDDVSVRGFVYDVETCLVREVS